MGSFKRLGSVAHNWAYSFLSLDNIGDNHEYIIDQLYRSALAANEPDVIIDVLEASLTPKVVNNRSVQKSIRLYCSSFEKDLGSQGCSLEMVQSVFLHLSFDLTTPPKQLKEASRLHYAFADPWRGPVCPNYKATIRLIDNRGKEHTATIPEWWKYG